MTVDVAGTVIGVLKADGNVTGLTTKIASRYQSGPSVRVNRYAGSPTAKKRDPRYLDIALVQIDCYAATEPAARALVDACVRALIDASASQAGGVITRADLLSTRDLWDPTTEPATPRSLAEMRVCVHPNRA